MKTTFETFLTVVFTAVMMDLRVLNPNSMTRVATFHSGRGGPDSTLELRVRALFTTGVALSLGPSTVLPGHLISRPLQNEQFGESPPS